MISNVSDAHATLNRADVNQDLEVNVADATLILRKSLGFSMAGANWNDAVGAGDVDCDGDVDTADAMLTLRYSLELGMTETAWCVEQETQVTIGAREVKSTLVEKGTMFASPTGSGNSCSENNPCSVQTAFTQVSEGDVLFLRGGVYDITANLAPTNSGTEDNLIVIESYPGEIAILEGRYSSASDVISDSDNRTSGIRIDNNINYISIRNIEIRHMGWSGILVRGSHNVIEGCHSHNNIFSGIAVYGGEWHEDNPNYQIPYPHGNYNVFRDNVINSNSDVGLNSNGGNADGIALSSGGNNTIIHNTVYSNSDDGIDTWRSNDSFIAFNLVYDNGKGDGDGNGVKMGGNASSSATNGLRTIANHNISYANKRTGIDYNSGKQLVIKYNTAFDNGDRGVNALNSSVIQYNIASDNVSQYSGLGTNNSWNVQVSIPFISTDANSNDFLRPQVGSQFEDKGVYADLTEHKHKIFIIGDSTVHNNSTGEIGYGSRLGEYMINPDNMFNMARSGASTKSYRPNQSGTTHDWPGLIDKIENTDIEDGAYLLIQFGHNDEDESRADAFTLPGRDNSFYNNLKAFIDEVKVLGVTPVLVTPVQRMYKGENRHITTYGDYPQTIRDLAADEGVLLLDLSQRSFDKFDEYTSTVAIFDAFAYDDHTHFDPDGAYVVAGWVRDLACESSDENLCNQFRR